MRDLIGKCGFICGHCPSYKENLKTQEDRERCSDGWHKYHGFRMKPEKLLRCDGCLASDEEKPVRYINCLIRRCAVFNGVETCAHCSAYPCEDVKAHSSGLTREKIAARFGIEIPDKAYVAFIEPYEGIKHLEEIRASLCREDIIEMTKVSLRPRITDFPDHLPFSKKETSAFRTLHRLLATMECTDSISLARKEMLNKRRQHFLKMLWAFGLFGKLSKKGGLHLEIDSDTYLAQKIQSDYSKVKDYFRILENYGVRCDLVPLVEKGWLTPKGSLRKANWHMKMSFSDDVGGASALRALQKYISRLSGKYGKQAFRYFSKADMRVLAAE